MSVARRVAVTRALLGVGAVTGAALVWVGIADLHPDYGIVAASGATLGLLWWWRGVFSERRVVLWLEERMPSLRYSLAALVEQPDTRFRPILEDAVGRVSFGRALVAAQAKLVGLPLLFLLAMHFIARPIVADVVRGADATRAGRDGPSRADRDGRTSFTATVTPPAYARIATQRIENPVSVAALVGSNIRFSGNWVAQATMPARPTVLRLTGASGQRMVALEPRADSSPRVVLELPARDTVLPAAIGALRLSATARDEFGIVAGWFEIIISSGSGESFKFRSAEIGRTTANGSRDLGLAVALTLDSLGLQPGDIVHLRAVARDANPAGGAEAGSSETRTLRVFRVGESDSVSIEAMLPPEVGRSELSQRMLIMMTEKLVAQVRRLERSAFSRESQSIGREQSRLRRRVGEIIFTRLTGEERADDEADAAIADTVDPGVALLRAAEAASGAEIDEHAHEEGGPVLGVNRPLLEAFNAMWEAERRLGISEPRQALPHMRAALDAIQRARAAERLYLRGRPPKLVLDIERIRLTGKKEGIDPQARAPGPSTLATVLARRARFNAALGLLEREPAAAIDSLVLVRVDALADDAALAASLDALIGDLRSGRDADASLRAAWRAIAGLPSSSRATRWSGAW